MNGALAILGNNIPSLRSLSILRPVRALRPLRIISRWEGMRLVVNSLVSSIPSISNVMLVCLIFWLIFGIVGVQLFGGKFFACFDKNGIRLPITIVNNRTDCEANFNNGYSWRNSETGFDNILFAYVSLFQVATFEGWMELMASSSDARGVDLQPDTDSNTYSLLYFVAFIVVGTFFILNLFIGVIIENFNTMRKKTGKEGALVMLLSEDQKRLYNTLKILTKARPIKVIPPPKEKCLLPFYKLVHSKYFEVFTNCLIVANTLTMAFDHNNISLLHSTILNWIIVTFTALFTTETTLKLIGLRRYYFTQAWNIFDIVIIVLSIVGIVLETVADRINFSLTILRVFRVARLGRLILLIRSIRGIRNLLFTLIISIPALFNIALLLAMVMSIYAVLGMALFSNLPRTDVITDMVNFETFKNSVILLFRLATAAGWNDILRQMLQSQLQAPVVCILFMLSYVLITFIVIINMYVAVIIENFNEVQEQELAGLTDDDFAVFYAVWSKYDPDATEFIEYGQLSSFLDELKPPLRIAKPNSVKIAALNFPVTSNKKLHCLDILKTLSVVIVGGVKETATWRELYKRINEKSLKRFPRRVPMRTITTTLMIWKEFKAAITIQQTFRQWRMTKALASRQNGQGQLPSSCDEL
ncbi:sodium channel protein 1 brain-like [Lissotriton helveticus]